MNNIVTGMASGMVGDMKPILMVIAAVVLVGCGKKEDGNTGVVKPNKPSPKAVPEKLIADPIVEKAIRKELEKPTGELTKGDLDKVTTLDLNYTKITDVGLKEVAKLQKLEWINLDYTEITDAGLKDVAKLKRLEQLFLNYTKITDVGLKEIAKMQQLKALGLGDTQVTKACVAELQKALPKCSVLASNPKK